MASKTSSSDSEIKEIKVEITPMTPKTKKVEDVKQNQTALTEEQIQALNEQYLVSPEFKNSVLKMQAIFRRANAKSFFNAQKDAKILDFEHQILEKSPVRDMMVYLFFLFIFALAVFWKVDSDSHYFVRMMDDWIVQEEFSDSDTQIYKNFESIGSDEEFWQYVEGPFLGNMFPEEGHEIFDGVAVVGEVRIRGIRVTDAGEDECYRPGMMKQVFSSTTCYRSMKDSKIEKNDFTGALPNSTTAATKKAFAYDAETDSHGTLYEAWKSSFPSTGGYILHLSNNLTNAEAAAAVKEVKDNGWLSKSTRGVFIEFAVYNKQTSIFIQCRLLIEFYSTGGAGTYPTFEIAKLSTVGSRDHLNHQMIAMVLRILVFVFVAVLILQEGFELYEDGWDYFRSLWNYLDIVNYFIFVFQIAFYISYMIYQSDVATMLEDESNTKFVDIGHLAMLYNYVDWIACVNIFFSSLKLFQYMETSKSMATILNTIGKAAVKLVPLFIFLVTIVFSFGLAFFVGFNNAHRNVRSLGSTLYTLGIAALGGGDSEWETAVYLTNRYVGTFLLIGYKFIIGFLLISMVVTIMDAAYGEITEHIDSDFENDVLVASLRIKMNSIYKNIYNKLTKATKLTLPKPKTRAITFRQVIRAELEEKNKKKHVRSIEERLESIERMLLREIGVVKNVRQSIDLENKKINKVLEHQ
jgi:hypothetical protein